MPQELVTETFTITAAPDVMRRFKRFLALLHCNSGWGHSAYFAMPLDGDGADRFRVHDFKTDYAADVELIGSVGYGVEIALTDGYTTKDFGKPSRHYIAKDGKLIRDGECIKEKRQKR